MKGVLKLDKMRYGKGKLPSFLKYYRKTQEATFPPIKLIYKVLYSFYRKKNHIDLSEKTVIGPGLYIGHPYCITVNPNCILGENINIHKGVTLGQENRGSREGAPVIGNRVWIGVNATLVGKIHIGNDVLIAPNSYVNCDIPDHSIVFGNPCIIKKAEGATEGYINNII